MGLKYKFLLVFLSIPVFPTVVKIDISKPQRLPVWEEALQYQHYQGSTIIWKENSVREEKQIVIKSSQGNYMYTAKVPHW